MQTPRLIAWWLECVGEAEAVIGEIPFLAGETIAVLELVEVSVMASVEATDGEAVVSHKWNDRRAGVLPPLAPLAGL